MTLDDLGVVARGLQGVRERTVNDCLEWRFHGRLVARQLDGTHVVVRSEFAARTTLVGRFPKTFSVPPRFERHMMVVCDLTHGDAGCIEDALRAAWELQRRND